MNNDYLNDEMEIDLLELLKALLKNIKKILICTLVCGTAMFVLSAFILPKSYNSSTDITIVPAGQPMDYTSYLVGDKVLNDVGSKLRMDSASLNELIVVTRDSNNSYNYNISVTTNDPEKSCNIASKVVDSFKSQLGRELNLNGVTTVNEAQVNTSPTSPNTKKNVMVGALAGFVLSAGVIILLTLMDDTIKSEDDIEKYLGLTTLATIPDRKDFITGKGPRNSRKSAKKKKSKRRKK